MHIEQLYAIYKQHPSIAIDTRNITADGLFFALKGANFDANCFAAQAFANGAAYAIIDDESFKQGDNYIVVDDVLETLQALACYHRQQLTVPIIGVTGTNGKTTSKELLYAVLSQHYSTYATKGNLNNHIGVPLSILAIDESYEIAIIEMGANHVREIASLCAICQPTHGLITNVGKAHLEGFGSFEGVKKAKGELYDYLQDHNGTLFLQGDNNYLVEMAAARNISKIVRYGFSAFNDVVGRLMTANPYLSIAWHQKQESVHYEVATHLTGSYNMENFLAAISTGLHFKISPTLINQGLSGYVPQNNRSQITKTARNTVVADFYNANASSMAAALDNMGVLTADTKVVILGDMFEMGDEAFIEHKHIIEKALQLNFSRLIFVGQEFYKQKSAVAEFYETTAQAQDAVSTVTDSTVLLKASRGMAFEHLLANL